MFKQRMDRYGNALTMFHSKPQKVNAAPNMIVAEKSITSAKVKIFRVSRFTPQSLISQDSGASLPSLSRVPKDLNLAVIVASHKHFNRSTASYFDDPMVDLNYLGIGKDCSGRTDEEGILQKGPWGPDEDRRLKKYVEMNGETNWGVIAKELNRTAKSCRLRWFNQLSPNINHKQFTPEEDEIIARMVCTRGRKWSQISKILQGRTDNQVKNRWNSNLRKYHSNPMPKSGNPSGKSSQPTRNKLKVSRLGAKSLSAPLRASARVSSEIGVQAPPLRPAACLPNSFMPPCYVAAHPEESLKYAPPATLSALAAPAPGPVFNNLDGFSLCPPGHETDDVLDPHLFPYTAPTGSFLL